MQCMHGRQPNHSKHMTASQGEVKSSHHVLEVSKSHQAIMHCIKLPPPPRLAVVLVPIMLSTLDRSLGSVPKPILKLACSHDLSPSHHTTNTTKLTCESPNNSPPEDLHMMGATMDGIRLSRPVTRSHACLTMFIRVTSLV
jgi:hypothetical protein